MRGKASDLVLRALLNLLDEGIITKSLNILYNISLLCLCAHEVAMLDRGKGREGGGQRPPLFSISENPRLN